MNFASLLGVGCCPLSCFFSCLTIQVRFRAYGSDIPWSILDFKASLSIAANDLKIDVYRSSGPGGQSVNTTDSAVRITYIPTGLVVTSQDEKSQLKNKNQAMRILRSRLLKARQDEAAAERAKDRKEQVGSGERSDKIRTYNYKDNRVSDHRINLTIKRLDQVLDGDLEDFVTALIADHETTRLANLEE